MDYSHFVLARKELVTPPIWSESEQNTGVMRINAPLSVLGVMEEGLALHGLCKKYAPEQNVCFELKAYGPKHRPISLARFEWRTLRQGHTNPRRRGSPVSGKRVGRTHYHSFELNWLENERRLRNGSLPMADDFLPEPQSFEALIGVVGNLFRINNMNVVTEPPWEYRLL
jgi:hypothetical protein